MHISELGEDAVLHYDHWCACMWLCIQHLSALFSACLDSWGCTSECWMSSTSPSALSCRTHRLRIPSSVPRAYTLPWPSGSCTSTQLCCHSLDKGHRRTTCDAPAVTANMFPYSTAYGIQRYGSHVPVQYSLRLTALRLTCSRTVQLSSFGSGTKNCLSSRT
jgi:hypothetical protein